jgi:hypothetical protein
MNRFTRTSRNRPEPGSFDAEAIDVAGLESIRKHAILNVEKICPKLGEWISAWVQTELMHRHNGTEPNETHLLALAAYTNWGNRDLGHAIQAITVLSYCSLTPDAAKFVDRQVWGVIGAAELRLTSKSANA